MLLNHKIRKHFIHTDDYLLSGILFGCGIIIGGVAATLYASRETYADGKEVLAKVKGQFVQSEENGPLEGSWIELQPKDVTRYNQTQKVFFGGLSRKENGKLIQYEFLVNAYSGDILDIYPVQ